MITHRAQPQVINPAGDIPNLIAVQLEPCDRLWCRGKIQQTPAEDSEAANPARARTTSIGKCSISLQSAQARDPGEEEFTMTRRR